MSIDAPLKVVLCWHMHQPEYRNLATGIYQSPWTYLHAIKDYIDMADIIEKTPGARAVINFSPILLDQIEDYAEEVRRFITAREAIRDPLLAGLAAREWPRAREIRGQMIQACLRANEERLINRFPAYRRLADFAALVQDDTENLIYLDDQFLADIITWYHLAWIGETVRQEDGRIRHLMKKARFFSLEDRHQLLGVIGELLASVVGRYRRLAEDGRIELSMTPYAHPILPLLINLESAKEAVPEAPLPEIKCYPGGMERARWHLEKGIDAFQHHFGFKPEGCWPAEGGISVEAATLMGEFGFKWTATGESVLRNSLAHSRVSRDQSMESMLHCVYRIAENAPVCFFRDDGLSDLIGFTYYNWHGDDAVANFVHHLKNISKELRDAPGRVVSIVMDGENAWESYPDNGYHFLTALYQRLAEEPELELATFSDCLENDVHLINLDRLIAGSWVYGTFSTWIGSEDKNRGWELLCQAKQTYDQVMAEGILDDAARARALQQLAVCEGSDWCWWFGDYNPSESVGDFDRLYRLHLSNLYHILGQAPPDNLGQVISIGGGRPEQGGVMRRGQAEAR